MATNTSTARSELSEPFLYRQPECKSYAEVVLEQFSFNYLDAEDETCTDPVELAFDIFVNDEFLILDPYQHQYGTELAVNCHIWYPFSSIEYSRASDNASRYTSVIRVPYDPSNPNLQIRAIFWDNDGSDWNFICFYGRDLLYADGSATGHLVPMSEDDWRHVDRAFEGKCATRNSNGELHGEAIIYYRVRGVVLPPRP